MTAIYHITHLSNLERIVQSGGIWCDFECEKQSLRPVSIAYANLKARRSRTPVPDQGGVLADYVPFYFSSRSPMLGAIHMGKVPDYTGGQESVVYLVSSVELIAQTQAEWCFTDGHAVESLTRFFFDVQSLANLDWNLIRSWRWRNSVDDPDRMRRKQAEFLVRRFVPWAWIESVATMTASAAQKVVTSIQQLGPKLVAVQPNWYYTERKS